MLHPPAAQSFRAEIQAVMNPLYREASETKSRNLPAVCKGGNGLFYNIASSRLTGHSERQRRILVHAVSVS